MITRTTWLCVSILYRSDRIIIEHIAPVPHFVSPEEMNYSKVPLFLLEKDLFPSAKVVDGERGKKN